jgi:ribosomal protein L11 methyltransferase
LNHSNNPSWTRFTFTASPAAEEELAASLCRMGATGVEVEARKPSEPEKGILVLHAFFDNQAVVPSESQILERLTREGAPGVSLSGSKQVGDGQWVEKWIAGLAPFDVGNRFTVMPVKDLDEPGFLPAAPEGRIPLRICPSRAFGTGEHPTTRLCLEELEHELSSGGAVLDVGTGSGILSIAASLLGASRVVGIDIDGEAVRVAALNARLNAGAEGVEFHEGQPSGSYGGMFQCVLANLNGFILDQVAPDLLEPLAPGGVLILSGILDTESERLAGKFAGLGAPLIRTTLREEWACSVHQAPHA